MLRTATRIVSAATLATFLLWSVRSVSAGPEKSILSPLPTVGDIFVCDASGQQGLVDYNPTSGQAVSISSGGLLTTPTGVAVESSTSALVSVVGKGIVRVNLLTGAQQLVSSGNHLSSNPDCILLGGDGILYVADLVNSSIVAVDPQSGNQLVVSSGGLISRPLFMAWQAGGYLLVSGEGASRIVQVRISDGAQSVVASGGLLQYAAGLAIDGQGRLIVADYMAQELIAINLSTGSQQVIGTNGLNAPLGIALDQSGNAYVGTYNQSTNGITKINLVTGQRVPIPTPSIIAFQLAFFGGALVPPPPPPPPPPSFLVASDDQPDGVHLIWGTAAGAAAYRIYRDGQQITTVDAPDTTYLDTPTLGTYNYCVAAANLAGNSSQVCDSGARRAYRPTPEIHFVRDVPNDQGGSVQVAWLRSEFDSPLMHTVTGYRVWRRLPSTDTIRGNPPTLSRSRGSNQVAGATDQAVTYWEPLTTIPAAMLEGYGVVVHTTQDSLPSGNPYTAFFVSALTADSAVFYDSDIDSGYSVDNLPPNIPSGLHGAYAPATGVTLSWRPNGEPDLSHYDVYRGNDAAFALSASSKLGATTDTVFIDAGGSVAYYKLVAVDIHGNASLPALLQPLDIPTSTLVSSADGSREGGVVRIRLVLSTLSAGLRALLFRGASQTFGDATLLNLGSVEVRQLDLDLLDATASPGIGYWYWVDLVDAEGKALLVGPIAVSAEAIPSVSVGPHAWPNPARGEATIWYTVGSDRAPNGPISTALQVYDARGRLVRSLGSSSAWPGTYQAVWDRTDQLGRRVSSGPYYLRLRVGGGALVGKITVVD